MLRDEYLTTMEVVKKCGVTRQTVYRWATQKSVKSVQFGNVRLIERASLKNMLQDKVNDLVRIIREI